MFKLKNMKTKPKKQIKRQPWRIYGIEEVRAVGWAVCYTLINPPYCSALSSGKTTCGAHSRLDNGSDNPAVIAYHEQTLFVSRYSRVHLISDLTQPIYLWFCVRSIMFRFN